MTAKKKEGEVIASSPFVVEQLVMKKDLWWRLKLTLKTSLPETFRNYSLRLSLNEEPYNVRIEDVRKQQEKVQDEEQLFGDAKKKQLKNFDERVKEIEKEMKEAKANAPEIEFEATVESLAYKDGDTVVILSVPSSCVQAINEHRVNLRHYKVDLSQ